MPLMALIFSTLLLRLMSEETLHALKSTLLQGFPLNIFPYSQFKNEAPVEQGWRRLPTTTIRMDELAECSSLRSCLPLAFCYATPLPYVLRTCDGSMP